jgi:TRAP-type mannitol/chloroaromatic compound transport system substrate-binding protein
MSEVKTSLLASATDPAIRLTGNISPELCDGGTYGWLYFQGTGEERNRVYSTALALSLTGKNVAIYANGWQVGTTIIPIFG